MSGVYTLHEATSREESDAIVDLAWHAYHEPYLPSFQAFHPVFGPTALDREAAVLADKERAWKTHLGYAKGASTWIYIVHEESGVVVGACQWLIFATTPWPNELPKITAAWWPEGEGREFVSEYLRQIYSPRQQWMNRPHIALNQTSVHPGHRRKGVGGMLMKWGIEKADGLGLEGFIEATPTGRHLYEKYGFRTLMKLSLDLGKRNPSQEWKRMMHDMCPSDVYITWRPVNGNFGEPGDGLPQTPWQVDQLMMKERGSEAKAKMYVMKLGD